MAMKTLIDPEHALANGLADIRTQFKVPLAFPPEVDAAAALAVKRVPNEHADRTGMPFVTLDPASSTDLDQAFAIETGGADLLLHYAIADVAWFVSDGDPVDVEAWQRGTTQYLPDGKAALYPRIIGENAASLLPDGVRPAIVFTVRIAVDGTAKLDGTERAIIHSRAKLAYDSVRASDLPKGFDELAQRIQLAEAARGAARVNPPEQQVEISADGSFAIAFRPMLESETRNAALSLATNLAVADLLKAHHTGLFRVMASPDERAAKRLRHTATAFGINWPENVPLDRFQNTLDPADPKQAAFMMAVRRAGKGASYEPFRAGVTPWHSAIAATYAHATAPLRRLADRYVIRAALAICNGQSVPAAVTEAFAKLPQVMARAGAMDGQISRAVIDLAEAALLHGREGQVFDAVVTDIDERGARIQLCDPAVITRVDADGATPGDRMKVRLISADPSTRAIQFQGC